jgi:biotin carboxylase
VPDPRLVLVGPSRGFADRAAVLGIDAFVVTSPEKLAGAAPPAAPAIVLDYARDPLLVPLLRAAHELTPFRACVSTTEDGLLPAARLNEALELDWVSVETVEATRDKIRMRERLAWAGVSPVAVRVCRSPDEVGELAAEIGFPVVLKPPDGMASAGVRLVASVADAEAAFSEAGGGPLLAEEFLEGPEYSVESFSFHGRHVVLAVTEKQVLGHGRGRFVEIGHALPARLSGDVEAEVRSVVGDVLSALELAEGPAHTEIKLTPGGVRVVETHNRPGGDHILELVKLVTGVDLDELTLGWAAGTAAALQEPVPANGAAAVRFLAPAPGRVASVAGVDSLSGTAGVAAVDVHVAPGDELRDVLSSDDRSGSIVCVGADVPEAVERCERAVERIGVEYARTDRAPALVPA